MKKPYLKLLLTFVGCISLISGCNQSSETTTPSTTDTDTTTTTTTDTNPPTTPGKKKVTVPKHTLSDSNSPVNVNSVGQTMTESKWNSFLNASASKFYGNYNFTYSSYSGGVLQTTKFTKNGYYFLSAYGKIYYEKIDNKVYTYVSTTEGWLRQETTFDFQKEASSIFINEIKVHMFEFSNYEFEDIDGVYYYTVQGSFTSMAKFQGGYLTYLHYLLQSPISRFEITDSFQTTIEIPESYYYE